MAQVIWTQPALSDLDDIAHFIALDNPQAAKKLVQSIFTKVERLHNFPESGRKIPELSHLDHREILVNPCRIFYKYTGDQVSILFVMRSERDLRKFMLQNTP